jgi:hypothetical protein
MRAGAQGTREEELDQLLRDEVFVDLYKVVLLERREEAGTTEWSEPEPPGAQ